METKLKEIVTLIDSKLAHDICVIDMKGVSILYDYFVIATIDSSRQAKALVGYIDELADKQGFTIKSVSGEDDSEWVLIDCDDIIIHLFTEKSRSIYNLEKLWADCPQIDGATCINN